MIRKKKLKYKQGGLLPDGVGQALPLLDMAVPGLGTGLSIANNLLAPSTFSPVKENSNPYGLAKGGNLNYNQGGGINPYGQDTRIDDDTFQVNYQGNQTDAKGYGQVNLDKGEIVSDNYVFSEDKKIPGTKQSFAKAAKHITTRMTSNEDRSNDVITTNTNKALNTQKQRLIQLQEFMNQQTRQGVTRNLAQGGYGGPGDPPTRDSIPLAPPFATTQSSDYFRQKSLNSDWDSFTQGQDGLKGQDYKNFFKNRKDLTDLGYQVNYNFDNWKYNLSRPYFQHTPGDKNSPSRNSTVLGLNQMLDPNQSPGLPNTTRQGMTTGTFPNINQLPGVQTQQGVQTPQVASPLLSNVPSPPQGTPPSVTTPPVSSTAGGGTKSSGRVSTKGYTAPNILLDGATSRADKKAKIEAFQKSQGLKVDGIYGKNTNRAYRLSLGNSPSLGKIDNIGDYQDQYVNNPFGNIPNLINSQSAPSTKDLLGEALKDGVPQTQDQASNKGKFGDFLKNNAGDLLQGLEIASKFSQLGEPTKVQANQISAPQIDSAPFLRQSAEGFNAAASGVNNFRPSSRNAALSNLYGTRLRSEAGTLSNIANQNKQLQFNTDQFNIRQKDQARDINLRSEAATDQSRQAAFETVGNTGRALNDRKANKQAQEYLATGYGQTYDFLLKDMQKRREDKLNKINNGR